LFSNSVVAGYMNEHFEPTWKSLRPVPKVKIDFGNGNVIDRTLNGNVATFVCTADGTVVDVLAGTYTPDNYLRRLRIAERMVEMLPTNPTERRTFLTNYHKRETERTLSGIYASDLPDDVSENGPRHKQIHQKLAELPDAKPEEITKWLYKEVLHADLDDPYLGLKPVLFASYPFQDDATAQAPALR
jgi:hypothetical protein